MRRIIIVEKGTDSAVWARCDTIPAYGSGEDETSAVESFKAAAAELAGFIKEETGSYPEWHSPSKDYEVRYDLSLFFQRFPIINVSQFALEVGINPTLMRRYKCGDAVASRKQKEKIQAGYDRIVARLAAVRF